MNSICFDTETTGLHPNGSDPDEILTISIIGRDGSVLLDERFRPTVKTEWPHASAVNGIYPEDVADLPTIETAIPRLREIFAGADEVIGYNVGFDLGFLSAVGVRPREDARITDTMKEFTWFMGRRYKLVDAADHIGYEWTGRAHGSLADALATLAVQRWLEQWLVKSGELTFTDAMDEEDAKRILVTSLLQSVPGIGASKAVVIMRLYRIPKGRRVGGLGIRQREALVALEKNGWKLGSLEQRNS